MTSDSLRDLELRAASPGDLVFPSSVARKYSAATGRDLGGGYYCRDASGPGGRILPDERLFPAVVLGVEPAPSESLQHGLIDVELTVLLTPSGVMRMAGHSLVSCHVRSSQRSVTPEHRKNQNTSHKRKQEKRQEP